MRLPCPRPEIGSANCNPPRSPAASCCFIVGSNRFHREGGFRILADFDIAGRLARSLDKSPKGVDGNRKVPGRMNDSPQAGLLDLCVLGDFQVARGGELVELPPSRKTRALLAYLAVTGRSHQRERLCEIFWDIP